MAYIYSQHTHKNVRMVYSSIFMSIQNKQDDLAFISPTNKSFILKH